MPNVNIFTYGSLMFPAVWSRLVRGAYDSVAARLDGYQRYVVLEQDYPGLIAQAGVSVIGRIYLAVDADDLRRLDVFEGDSYRRKNVHPVLANGTTLEAQSYLWVGERGLSALPWQPHGFDLEAFLVARVRPVADS